ncbi:uncharacterized protein PG998_014658 [Apiospora kogelbergensis]|uniref:uncharacterized protein n=1 Tax=Apiospora kogelbergensis TaxID=1337665 RepID=UPI00303B04ED
MASVTGATYNPMASHTETSVDGEWSFTDIGTMASTDGDEWAVSQTLANMATNDNGIWAFSDMSSDVPAIWNIAPTAANMDANGEWAFS